jgi:hypothetical protein
MTMVVAVAGVAFMIYPVLRRVADTGVRQGLAAWYVGTRITESGPSSSASWPRWHSCP